MILFLISLAGSAQTFTVEALKKQFEPEQASYWAQLERAQSLQATTLDWGQPLSSEECLNIQAQIRAAYATDPMNFAFHEGQAKSVICAKRGANFLYPTSGTSSSGLAYAQVLQVLDDEPSYRNDRSYYLNENHRIIEMADIHISKTDPLVAMTHILSIDVDQNLYSHFFIPESKDARRKITGPWHRSVFVSGTGETPEPWIHVFHMDKDDPSKSRDFFRWSKNLKKNWDEFSLPLTLGVFGGFYRYQTDWYRTSENWIRMESHFLNGKEVCTVGAEQTEHQRSLIPADFKTYSQCVVQ